MKNKSKEMFAPLPTSRCWNSSIQIKSVSSFKLLLRDSLREIGKAEAKKRNKFQNHKTNLFDHANRMEMLFLQKCKQHHVDIDKLSLQSVVPTTLHCNTTKGQEGKNKQKKHQDRKDRRRQSLLGGLVRSS